MGGLRWAAFRRKPKPAGTFFQIWVVCQGNASAGEHQLSASAGEHTPDHLTVRSGLVWAGVVQPEPVHAVMDPTRRVLGGATSTYGLTS